MRKKYFLFLPLDKRFRVCYTIRANSKKLSRFVSSGKGHRFQSLRRWPFLLFRKSFNYISFFLFVNRSFQKIFFIFPLDKAWNFLYNVCGLFLPGLFLSLSYRWSIKRPFSFEDDLFLFVNLLIIQQMLFFSIPKILEKYFIFPIDNQRKPVII